MPMRVYLESAVDPLTGELLGPALGYIEADVAEIEAKYGRRKDEADREMLLRLKAEPEVAEVDAVVEEVTVDAELP